MSLLQDVQELLRSHPAFKRGKATDLMSIQDAKRSTLDTPATAVEETALVIIVIRKLLVRSITRFPARWSYESASKTLLASLGHRDEVKSLLDTAHKNGELDVAEIKPEGQTILSIQLK